jgi:hypothetical protein
MKLVTETYLTQEARWPQTGRHILAQFDDETVLVYQAFRPETGHFAARHGYFGEGFEPDELDQAEFSVDDVPLRMGK